MLLVALLLLQCRAAVGACLINAYAPFDVPAATAGGERTSDSPADPCCPHENVPAKACAETCAPSASVSTTPTDQLLAVAPFALSVPRVVVETPSGNAPPVVRSADDPPGTPLYLRFLRLLN